MTYDELVRVLGSCGWFDLATLVQVSGERRKSLLVQLYRWCRGGKLLPLRRGMYAFPERYRGREVNPVDLANRLHSPSYLSRHWALGYYGMIPERVVEFTSVTSRAPRRFDNALGVFTYRHVKPAAFFGYVVTEIRGSRVLVAEPEKALLDLWYLDRGDWTGARMRGMRFQGFDKVRTARLLDYAARFNSPRLKAAVAAWEELSESKEEEGVTL